MGRQRRISPGNVYHIMARGTGRQLIFEDDDDCTRFARILSHCLEKESIAVLSWCFMPNHIHLLVLAPIESVSLCMGAALGTYARSFNAKYDRVGHLFQGRFLSEPIDSDAYLLAVVRYIHQNPMKAGLSLSCKCKWSSYSAYLGSNQNPLSCKTDFVLDYFAGLEEFRRFHAMNSDDYCLDIENVGPLRISETLKIARETLRPQLPSDVKELPPNERSQALILLHSAGLTIRQIERITGIGRGSVFRAISTKRSSHSTVTE